MTQEEKDLLKELLLSLLEKANQNSLLHIYDDKENIYDIDWLYIDKQICIKIKEF